MPVVSMVNRIIAFQWNTTPIDFRLMKSNKIKSKWFHKIAYQFYKELVGKEKLEFFESKNKKQRKKTTSKKSSDCLRVARWKKKRFENPSDYFFHHEIVRNSTKKWNKSKFMFTSHYCRWLTLIQCMETNLSEKDIEWEVERKKKIGWYS